MYSCWWSYTYVYSMTCSRTVCHHIASLFTMIFQLLLFPFHRLKKHFKSATTGVATKTMRNELNRLVNTVTITDSMTKRVSFYLVLTMITIVAIVIDFVHLHRLLMLRCNHSFSYSLVILLRKRIVKSCMCLSILTNQYQDLIWPLL